MLARLQLALVVSATLLAPRDAKASPITYGFIGNLGQPIDGSGQVSGSFTIDTAPTVLPDGTLQENGGDVSLTVKFGGQTFSFGNSPQTQTSASFQGGLVPVVYLTGISTGGDSPSNEIGYSVLGQASNDQMRFGIDLYRSGTTPQVGDLEHLALPTCTSSFWGELPLDGKMAFPCGTLTSVELVSAPEPSALAVFGTIAVAGMAHRRLRRSRGRHSLPH